MLAAAMREGALTFLRSTQMVKCRKNTKKILRQQEKIVQIGFGASV